LVTSKEETYLTHNVLLAIGRRGTPRKLGIPGEDLQKVAYRLIESERISDKKIIVVGGGDSAIESALLLKDNNEVILSYRKEKFARLKPKNRDKILAADEDKSINIMYNTNLVAIAEDHVLISNSETGITQRYDNDLVYIFAGGEMPTKFLNNAGIEIKKRFGYIMKKHS
jgi:thioredoxin reductase